MQSRFADPAILSLLIVVSATPSGRTHAEPILLAEWTRSEGAKFNIGPTPPTIPFRFTVRLDLRPGEPTVEKLWSQNIGHADVGQTFEAPVDIVTPFSYAFGNSMVRFGGGVGEPNNDSIGPLSAWQSNPLNYTQHVPVLSDYRITRITRTVNSLILQPFQQQSHHEGGRQTIRFYGEEIPPVAGDFNKDGTTDAVDYVVWKDRVANNELMPNGVGQGPFAGRAVEEDYDHWRANFGRTAFPVTTASLPQQAPEPTSTWLLLVGLVAFLHFRIRRSVDTSAHH